MTNHIWYMLIATSFVVPVPGVNLTIGLLTSELYLNETLFPLQMAVEDVNKNPTLLPDAHIQLNVSKLPFSCDRNHFTEKYREMLTAGMVTAFASAQFCEFSATVASEYGEEITISHACSVDQFSDKLQYPRFIRTYPSDSHVVHPISSFLSSTKWDRIVVVVQNQRKWTALCRLVLEWSHEYRLRLDYISWFNYTATCRLLKKSCCREHWAKKIVYETYYMAKVYIFLGDSEPLQEFLAALSRVTTVAERRVAVVTYDDSASSLRDNDASDLTKHNPTELGLFVITRRIFSHEAFDDFSNRLRILKNTKGETNDTDESASVRAAYIYDAVTVYAQALDLILGNQRITEDQVPRIAANGTALFEVVTSVQNFTSVTGELISFDRNGDRLVPFVVIGSLKWTESRGRADSIGISSKVVGRFNSDGQFVPETTISWSVEEPKIPVVDKPSDSSFFWILCCLTVTLTTLLYPAVVRKVHQYLNRRMETNSIGETTANICLPQHMVPVNEATKARNNNRTDWQLKVHIRRFSISPTSLHSLREVKELAQLRQKHPNITRLMGFSVTMNRIILVSEYCAHRSLWDLLWEGNRRLGDGNVVASLVLDLIQGMIYLHQQREVPVANRVHGNLKSTNCLVDSRWNLKLTDFGLRSWRSRSQSDTDAENLRRLWWAPELLRDEKLAQAGTQKGDIYAFGIILHEILGKRGPFGIWSPSIQIRKPKDVIERVKRGPTGRVARYRPPLDCVVNRRNGLMDPHLCWCMKDCWREDPCRRPKSFVHIRQGLQDLDMTQGIDFVMQIATASDRSPGIDTLLDKRRQIMRQRKQKLDKLLSFIMPIQRRVLTPRSLSQVSILVVDIVRFTDIAAMLTPLQTVHLLDDVYSLFDDVCRGYGGNFKIGTIGDAYIAAGVDSLAYQSLFEVSSAADWNPIVQIAKMAQEFLARTSSLNIPEIGQPLNVRVGIHQGPAVLGLVDWYWVFGHSFSVAFQMQSTGRRSAIQLSRAFYEELVKSGQFHDELDPPPTVEVDRTGQESYWLRSSVDHFDYGGCPDSHPLKLCYRGSFVTSSPRE